VRSPAGARRRARRPARQARAQAPLLPLLLLLLVPVLMREQVPLPLVSMLTRVLEQEQVWPRRAQQAAAPPQAVLRAARRRARRPGYGGGYSRTDELPP
jgi:hypothetical protein